jgi:ATP-dependent Clp protease ATP-binding subunit ClpX
VIPTPSEIVAQLDRYVYGQSRAKRTLATAVHGHYLNVAYSGSVRIKKANVLLFGPSGSGKTYLCQTVARLLDVPFDSITASSISPAGWIGDKAETVVERMYQRAKQRWGKEAWAKALTGICYVDEIDKLAARGQPQGATPGPSGDQHFNTTQVQQALLRVIEGVEIKIDGNSFPTDRVLFIASGAFVGLDLIVRRRETGGRFDRSVKPVNSLRSVIPKDLIDYGLLTEFVGRFPVTAALDPLGEDDLVPIVRDVEDSLLSQKRAMLSVRGCDLEIEEPILRNIARSAIAQGTGARGLQTMIEKLLEPLIYDLESGTTLHIGVNGVERRSGVVSTSDALAPPPSCDGEPTSAAATSERIT